MKTNRAVVGLGSNIDPEENIRKAIEIIRGEVRLIEASSFVETEPVGLKEQRSFINGALLIETSLGASELKTRLREMEAALGRVRTGDKNGPRTIDLDILVWNGEVVDDDVYEREFLRSSIRELIPGFTF
ncbi:MAG TPA: 2-amino-4-hydroxy-6-hydroxymethyldihydropteridine diphosphokinase [Thermodesulfobacteriota bacterium]|nr:2-amino-4-hydroxy-6-hydroxymethyldihydropteridine diphosphokinase [Thermodesulfobacteriota bacterium]